MFSQLNFNILLNHCTFTVPILIYKPQYITAICAKNKIVQLNTIQNSNRSNHSNYSRFLYFDLIVSFGSSTHIGKIKIGWRVKNIFLIQCIYFTITFL